MPKPLGSVSVEEGSLEVDVYLAVVDGRAECVRLDVRARPGAALGAAGMRSIRIGRLRDFAIDYLARQGRIQRKAGAAFGALGGVDDRPTGVKRAEKQRLVAIDRAAQGGRRHAGRPTEYGPDHYREVARIYLEARRTGSRKPTADVANQKNVTRSAASKWIAKARELGYLPRLASQSPRREP